MNVHPEGSPVPAGRLICFITGVLRRETPEEHVRQRVARALVQEYGYDKRDIGIEAPVQLGVARKRADIVVYTPGSAQSQQDILLIVETKQESVKPSDRDNGVEQLHSYLAASPSASWGLWVGQQMIFVRKVVQDNVVKFDDDEPDIPPAGGSRPERLTPDKLIPAVSLKPAFRRVHNYIYANEGMQKDQAFKSF